VAGAQHSPPINRLVLGQSVLAPGQPHSQRTEEQSALEDAINLNLPIVSYEMLSVRRDDFDSATLVGELGRRGHSANGVDVEI
jgi:hypothetical protein